MPEQQVLPPMRRHLTLSIASAAVALTLVSAAEASWIFRPSKYTHNPVTGERVDQYAPKKPAIVRTDPTYMQSGYRHSRITQRGIDGSADRLHIVETWGAGDMIRPYGEWMYPYRAGATPYGPWGSSRGPWTMPFDSWSNPYGLGRLPYYGQQFGPHYPSGYARPYQQAPLGHTSPGHHDRGRQRSHGSPRQHH